MLNHQRHAFTRFQALSKLTEFNSFSMRSSCKAEVDMSCSIASLPNGNLDVFKCINVPPLVNAQAFCPNYYERDRPFGAIT
jgi:hypothetical protein